MEKDANADCIYQRQCLTKRLELFRRQNRGWAGGCKGVGIVGANSCGISYNRGSQRGAVERIECDTIRYRTHTKMSPHGLRNNTQTLF